MAKDVDIGAEVPGPFYGPVKPDTVFLYFFIFSFMIILLFRESDQSAIVSLLRSFQPSVYHSKMGESR